MMMCTRASANVRLMRRRMWLNMTCGDSVRCRHGARIARYPPLPPHHVWGTLWPPSAPVFAGHDALRCDGTAQRNQLAVAPMLCDNGNCICGRCCGFFEALGLDGIAICYFLWFLQNLRESARFADGAQEPKRCGNHSDAFVNLMRM